MSMITELHERIAELEAEKATLEKRTLIAMRRWFYTTFEDDLLERMQKAGIIAQAEAFSLGMIAEMELEIEEVFNGKSEDEDYDDCV